MGSYFVRVPYVQQRFILDPYYATLRGDRRYNHLFVNTLSQQWVEQTVALEQHAWSCADASAQPARAASQVVALR